MSRICVRIRIFILIPKGKLIRAREEVRNDPEVSERFVGVFDFLAHPVASLSASTRLGGLQEPDPLLSTNPMRFL